MKLRNGFIRSLPAVICGVVIAWCCFYLLFGSSSVFVLQSLKVQKAGLEHTASTLVAQRSEVEDRVVRLRPNTLDWDLVEQEAQAKLGPSPENTKSLKM